MTVVQFKESHGHKHLLADGHANYSEAGTDIVCASVSILLQSLIRECQKEEDRGKIKISQLEIKDGYVHMVVYDPTNRMNNAFSLVKTGIEMLEETYPENVLIL